MYRVQISSHGARDLDEIFDPDLSRIKSRILSLESTPRPPGVKKLKDHLHRIRVGDWRILYAIDDHEKTVIVLRILRRSERTYKGI